jgi:hypothetical protein
MPEDAATAAFFSRQNRNIVFSLIFEIAPIAQAARTYPLLLLY